MIIKIPRKKKDRDKEKERERKRKKENELDKARVYPTSRLYNR